MRKFLFMLFLGIGCSLLLPNEISAQNYGRGKKKRKKAKTEKPSFKLADKLWYGGGFGMGLGGNTFNLNLSPMVGYKLTKGLSAGVRLPLEYNYAKLVSNDGTGFNYNNIDYGVGGFTRLKFFQNVFAHAEYNYLWIKQPVTQNGRFLLDPNDPTKLLQEKINDTEFNVGLGYASGGRIGYEISLLYNVLEDADSDRIPWSIRAGFNYKF